MIYIYIYIYIPAFEISAIRCQDCFIYLYVPVAVPPVKVIGTVITLLLTIPPDIITVADITPDDSVPLNVDDENVIIATVQ